MCEFPLFSQYRISTFCGLRHGRWLARCLSHGWSVGGSSDGKMPSQMRTKMTKWAWSGYASWRRAPWSWGKQLVQCQHICWRTIANAIMESPWKSHVTFLWGKSIRIQWFPMKDPSLILDALVNWFRLSCSLWAFPPWRKFANTRSESNLNATVFVQGFMKYLFHFTEYFSSKFANLRHISLACSHVEGAPWQPGELPCHLLPELRVGRGESWLRAGVAPFLQTFRVWFCNFLDPNWETKRERLREFERLKVWSSFCFLNPVVLKVAAFPTLADLNRSGFRLSSRRFFLDHHAERNEPWGGRSSRWSWQSSGSPARLGTWKCVC